MAAPEPAWLAVITTPARVRLVPVVMFAAAPYWLLATRPPRSVRLLSVTLALPCRSNRRSSAWPSITLVAAPVPVMVSVAVMSKSPSALSLLAATGAMPMP